jgi:hypothetical protein
VSVSWRMTAAVAALVSMQAGAALAAGPSTPSPGHSGFRQVYVRLANDANAVIDEPVKTDPVRSQIALLVAHPEHANVFNSFPGAALASRGYRVMLMDYYGPEHVYENLLPPVAAAVRYLRQMPGVRKIVLVGESTGGSLLTYYQDVAENGPKQACQGAERTYKCSAKGIEHLPPADAVVLLDANVGAPCRLVALDPAVDTAHPWQRNAALDMFNARNGFDAATGQGHYSTAFVERYLAAQGRRNDRVIARAQADLARIQAGKAKFKDDGQFLVAGFSVAMNGARLDLADLQLMSRTHAPHLLLKADGKRSWQIIRSVRPPMASASDLDLYYRTTPLGNQTVRHYLSFYGLRTKSDYAITADDVKGVEWRSTANDAVGNVEGIRVPTLVMAGSCFPHMVMNEIVFDHSAAKDKEYVAVEGANHSLAPCRPEYGDTRKRAFDFVSSWLTQPGRLLTAAQLRARSDRS